ncbi:MAG TPA: heme biosynthesis HemY N-terminal domain-containing protein [Xanthobacteraceae bacterium]|nr:heme biosynthesis HemY N-terminal domain-containing protein [Xanthobacteraceae bacterium]
MIRIVIFLALASILALGAVWVADRPGDVAVTWLGWRLETSVLVAAVALMIVVMLAVLAWSLVHAIWSSPHAFANFLRLRRLARGDRAISRGLIAVGAGDLRSARKFSVEAGRLRGSEPLALLLNAQTAQLSGDRSAADTAFRTMAGRADTKLLGLRGLFVEARRRDDLAAARSYAEEAARTAPDLAWAGQAALEFRCVSGDWDGALAALERNMQNKLIDKATYRRQRAVLLTAAALAVEETDRDRTRELALEAVKLAPTLVPAAELAGRMLAETRKLRRAGRIIEKAWTANPHPDLAQVYAYLRFGDAARDRLSRVQALAQMAPGHIESAIAVARAAIDAHEFSVARTALAPLLDKPTQRVAELMAELEHAESGNEGRTREWMARALRAPRDAAWTADGFVSDRWLPVSPVNGRIDAFEWKVPLAALGSQAAATIEADGRAAFDDAMLPKAMPPADAQAQEPAARPAATGVTARAGSALSSDIPVEAVIPLVHAPDDPGPDSTIEPEASPEPAAPDTWWRIRFFR